MIVVDEAYIPPKFVGDDDVAQHIVNIVDEKQRSKVVVVDTIDFSDRALLVRQKASQQKKHEELKVLKIRSGLTVSKPLEDGRQVKFSKSRTETKENVYKKIYPTTRKQDLSSTLLKDLNNSTTTPILCTPLSPTSTSYGANTHYQEYFERKQHRNVTSHHTLEKLPPLSRKELDEAIAMAISCHVKERQHLIDKASI
jgi:hypothetical protein